MTWVGFRMFDDQIGTAVEVDRFAKRGFYLFGDTEGVENRGPVLVNETISAFFRCDALDIGLGVRENIPVVDYDPVEIFVEQVTKNTVCLCLFAQNPGG